MHFSHPKLCFVCELLPPQFHFRPWKLNSSVNEYALEENYVMSAKLADGLM